MGPCTKRIDPARGSFGTEGMWSLEAKLDTAVPGEAESVELHLKRIPA